MLLTIYDKAGTKRADVAVNDSSTQSKEVQGDNVLSLSFSYYAFLPLDVNDYTDYLGERACRQGGAPGVSLQPGAGALLYPAWL